MTTTLSAKERTLVGIGAAVASGCQPCTARYIEAARAAGACERSIRLAVETALDERRKATDAMAEWAQSAQGVVPVVDATFRTEKQKNRSLIATVAAHVSHSTSTLSENLSQALELGWSATQVAQAIQVGQAVTKVAADNTAASARQSGIGAESASSSCGEESAGARAPAATSAMGCGCANGCPDA